MDASNRGFTSIEVSKKEIVAKYNFIKTTDQSPVAVRLPVELCVYACMYVCMLTKSQRLTLKTLDMTKHKETKVSSIFVRGRVRICLFGLKRNTTAC